MQSTHIDTPLAHELIESIVQHSWWTGNNYFDPGLIEQLAAEAQEYYQTQRMTEAGIGRNQHFQRNRSIRRDFIEWLDGKSKVQLRYLEQMEALRLLLNRELFLGLFEFEAHYAVYQPGGFYKKHLDSFQGAANRIVSVVSYLNSNWPEDGGGELCIYSPDSDRILVTIPPLAGTLVIFLSEKIPHAVRTSRYQRASIAGWFRLRTKPNEIAYLA